MGILIYQSNTWVNLVVTSSWLANHSPHLHLFNSTVPTQYIWLVGRLIPKYLGFVMAAKPKKQRLHVRKGAQANVLMDSFHELRGSIYAHMSGACVCMMS